MINFSKLEEDVLLEVCNIGMSKAAKQLSVLLNGPVLLENPSIELLPLTDIKTYSFSHSADVMSMVHQRLENDLDGHALLVFKREHTQLLLEQVMGEVPNLSEVEMRTCEQEAMLEIGNIVISSCITAMVDMLTQKVGLSVPHYYEGTFKTLLVNQKPFLDKQSSVVMVLSTTMSTKLGTFSGRLMLFVSSSSIEAILKSIDEKMGM